MTLVSSLLGSPTNAAVLPPCPPPVSVTLSTSASQHPPEGKCAGDPQTPPATVPPPVSASRFSRIISPSSFFPPPPLTLPLSLLASPFLSPLLLFLSFPSPSLLSSLLSALLLSFSPSLLPSPVLFFAVCPSFPSGARGSVRLAGHGCGFSKAFFLRLLVLRFVYVSRRPSTPAGRFLDFPFLVVTVGLYLVL